MTPATAKSSVWTNWHWPDDVTAFAKEHGVEGYLEPLREASARVFPTAVRARAVLDLDPELRDVRHIEFRIDVPDDDVPDLFVAWRAWDAELIRIVPTVKTWAFRLFLYPVE
jgi:hypothetical protein